MPAPLLEAYNRAIEDTELRDLTRDIATVEAKINDTLLRLATAGDAEGVFSQVVANYRLFREASRKEKDKEAARRLDRLDELTDQAENEALLWDQWREDTKLKKDLIDSEEKRRERIGARLDAEEATRHYYALAMSVRKNVIPGNMITEQTLYAIAEDFVRLTGRAALPRSDSQA